MFIYAIVRCSTQRSVQLLDDRHCHRSSSSLVRPRYAVPALCALAAQFQEGRAWSRRGHACRARGAGSRMRAVDEPEVRGHVGCIVLGIR